MASRIIAPLFLNLNTRSWWVVSFATWVALPMEKEFLLPNSIIWWVCYSGALDVLQKRKLTCPYQKSNPVLSCPYHRHWTDCAIYSHWRNFHTKLCVQELIKIWQLQRLNWWLKTQSKRIILKLSISCIFYINVPVHFTTQMHSIIYIYIYIYIYTHTHTHAHTRTYLRCIS
jgi:hypothetical protein